MKIGVLTYHHAKHSFGASLQTFATIRVLEKLGYNVELINYENAYEQAEIKDRGVSFNIRILMHINKAIRMYLYNGRKDPYLNSANLDKIYGCVSKTVYRNAAEMRDLDFDVMLVGSDQVWNPHITGNLDKVFLLMFGHAKRRISYASSMGSYILNEYEREIFREALVQFSSISVREVHAKEQLQQLVEKDIKIVADPTLLMTREEWHSALNINENSERDQPYILTYFIGGNLASYWDDVKKYVSELKLPIWNIQSHSRKNSYVDKAILGATLGDIVSLISNATLIITDSFHGTAFSINFQKQFVSLPNKNNPIRIIELLKLFGISDRINISERKALIRINYDEVTKRLELLRSTSLLWLKKAIEI